MVRLVSGDASGSGFQLSRVSSAGPDTDTQCDVHLRRAMIISARSACRCSSGREIHAAPTWTELAESGRCQRGVRQEIQSRPRRRRQAHASRRPRNASSTSRSSAWRRNTTYNEVKERGAAAGGVCRTARIRDVGSTHFYVRTTGSEDDLHGRYSTRSCATSIRRCRWPTFGRCPRRSLENVSLDRFVTTMSAAFASAGHAAGGARSLRCAGLHGDAADAGIRAADGARRRRRERAAAGAAPGGSDDVPWARADWPRIGARPRAAPPNRCCFR